MGLSKSQQSLKNWTAQKWRTSDGKPSKGKKRYLPDAAWKSLSPSEKASTNAAKAKGNAKGEQFVAQPKKIKEKTKSFRELGGIINKLDDMKMKMKYEKGGKKSTAKKSFMEDSKEIKFGAPSKDKKMMGGKMMYKKGGSTFPDLTGDGEITKADILKGRGVNQNKKMMGGKMEYKKGGKKTMEPGGGGRFAKMVNKMKGEGKSEESAKAIAASVGRKKYGKSKFQEMAAAGKKKMMGGKKC